MAAPEGNEVWKARSSHGRNPKFESPAVLWDACIEYFQWVEDNPLKEEKVFASKGEILRAEVAKMRAMTITGLCIFLDIASETWANYRKRDDFLGIVTRVEEIIRDQKFAGAAADMLNPNIIARDLGLRDKQEVINTIQDYSDDELDKRIEALTNGGKTDT